MLARQLAPSACIQLLFPSVMRECNWWASFITKFMKGVRRATPRQVFRAAPWVLPLVLQSLTRTVYESVV